MTTGWVPDGDDRDYRDAVAFPESVVLRPIARVRSPFVQRHGTPRQPGLLGPRERGERGGSVVLLDDQPQALLQDLAAFDVIWLVFWFHLNGPRRRPLVRPPRGGPKRGVLSTRAPHRPNPIGLSAVPLLGVEGRTLRIGPHDLLDGTPVLDIKPYIAPYDAFPDASVGWLERP